MNFLLFGLLLIAVIYDFKYRRIPNWLIAAGLLAALGYHSWQEGLPGFLFSIKGFGAGIGILFIPFVMGGLGAGDVKLLGVVGALKGWAFGLNTCLWMALWGGFIAVLILYRHGRLEQVIKNILPGQVSSALSFRPPAANSDQLQPLYYPYALAIALGVLSSFLKGWF